MSMHPLLRDPSGPGGRRLAVRTAVIVAILIGGASVVGAAIVSLLVLVLGGDTAAATHHLTLVVGVGAGYLSLAMAVGTVAGVLLQRRTTRWMWDRRHPTPDEVRTTLRLPRHMAAISAVLWAVGAVVFGLLASVLVTGRQTLLVVVSIALGGLTTACVSYLLADRAARPIVRLALAAHQPERSAAPGVLPRLFLTWLLASGVPLGGLLAIALTAQPGGLNLRPAVTLLALTALLVGGLATVMTSRAVAQPLRAIRETVERVGTGDFSQEAEVTDASEIGLLQDGVNEMVRGLRERERMRDLFDKHVGSEVAEHAMSRGADLSGEIRPVVALFIDVIGSTRMAGSLPPQEMATLLNRFFGSVVEALTIEGGIVNKFEGDAALCLFGAPTTMTDPARSALRAARRMRREITAMGELDFGIGISVGDVFAGYLGAENRFEYTVIGDAVNEAARLADAAKRAPGRIVVAGQVVDNVDALERMYWRGGSALTLRGRDVPTATWVPAESVSLRAG